MSYSETQPDGGLVDAVVAGLMILMGAGITGVWTADIVKGDKVDLSSGVFRAREGDGDLLWPHWVAEYATAFLLIVAGIGLLVDSTWAVTLTGLAIGALFYTSVNSLGWAAADRDRYSYAVPMVVGVVVSFVCGFWLLAR